MGFLAYYGLYGVIIGLIHGGQRNMSLFPVAVPWPQRYVGWTKQLRIKDKRSAKKCKRVLSRCSLEATKTPREREREGADFFEVFGEEGSGGESLLHASTGYSCCSRFIFIGCVSHQNCAKGPAKMFYDLLYGSRIFRVCSWFSITFPIDFEVSLAGATTQRPRYQGWGSQKRMSTVLAAMEELPKRVRRPRWARCMRRAVGCLELFIAVQCCSYFFKEYM